MFHLILIAAIVLLTIGFIAALVHYPLDAFAGENAKATRWAKAARTFCGYGGLWAGGFVASLFALAWLADQNIWLYSAVSLAIGASFIACFGTLTITGICCPFFWRDVPTRREKAYFTALALVCFIVGASGIYNSVGLFFTPVYSAII